MHRKIVARALGVTDKSATPAMVAQYEIVIEDGQVVVRIKEKKE